MVVCGARLYGFTDLVPGLFYVKTKFIHLMYFPLYPIATYIIFQEPEQRNGGGGGSRGLVSVEIPSSFKSQYLAWGRASLLFLTFYSGLASITVWLPDGWDEDQDKNQNEDNLYIPPFPRIMIAILFLVLSVSLWHLYYHKSFNNASHERATELCSLLDPATRSDLQHAVDSHFNLEASFQRPNDSFV